jgi:hypothetical protein
MYNAQVVFFFLADENAATFTPLVLVHVGNPIIQYITRRMECSFRPLGTLLQQVHPGVGPDHIC